MEFFACHLQKWRALKHLGNFYTFILTAMLIKSIELLHHIPFKACQAFFEYAVSVIKFQNDKWKLFFFQKEQFHNNQVKNYLSGSD